MEHDDELEYTIDELKGLVDAHLKAIGYLQHEIDIRKLACTHPREKIDLKFNYKPDDSCVTLEKTCTVCDAKKTYSCGHGHMLEHAIEQDW